MWALAGELGLLALALCFLFRRYIEPQDTCLYPFQAVRGAAFVYFALAGLLAEALARRDSRRIAWLAAATGATNGFLGLWHGATFFAATFASGMLGLWFIAGELRTRPVAWRRLGFTALAFAGSFGILFGLLIVPQWLHYGHLQRPDAARLWLENYYGGGTSFSGFSSLVLVPRTWPTLLVLIFIVASFFPSRRRAQLPLALKHFLLCVVAAHLRLRAQRLDPPAPERAWPGRCSRLRPTLLGFGGTADGRGRGRSHGLACRAGPRRRSHGSCRRCVRQIGLHAALSVAGFDVVAFTRGEPISAASGNPHYANTSSRAGRPAVLRRQTVLLCDNPPLRFLAMADFQRAVGAVARPYQPVRTRRRGARRRQRSTTLWRERDFPRAESILNEYHVGGFIFHPSAPDPVARACGGDILVPSKIDVVLQEYRGHCGDRQTR